ncbi:MAG: hypothetical protein VB876_09575, partial [Pirellulales bacterium]
DILRNTMYRMPDGTVSEGVGIPSLDYDRTSCLATGAGKKVGFANVLAAVRMVAVGLPGLLSLRPL